MISWQYQTNPKQDARPLKVRVRVPSVKSLIVCFQPFHTPINIHLSVCQWPSHSNLPYAPPPPKAPNQLNYSLSGCARACGAQGEAVGAMGTPPLPPPLAAVFSPPPPNGTGSGGETPADEEAIDSLAVFTQLLTLLTCILAGYFLHTRRITVMHEVRQRSRGSARDGTRGHAPTPARPRRARAHARAGGRVPHGSATWETRRGALREPPCVAPRARGVQLGCQPVLLLRLQAPLWACSSPARMLVC